MTQIRLSVVIPAHNEEENLPQTIFSLEQVLRNASVPHEIVVVDDHSTDRTVEVVEELRRLYPDIRIVKNERPNGFGHAVQTGIDAYEGDAFCLVMADGSDEPRDIVKYYEKLSSGYECVFGSRFMSGAEVVNYPKHKLLLNRLANWFIQLLFGLRYNDVTNAFKCYHRSVLDGLAPILSHHFNLTVELPLKAIVRGYSYTVVPTNWYGRMRGISKLRIREMGSRYLFIILYVLLERLLSRGDYHRAGARTAAAESGTPRPRLKWAWLAFAAAVLTHVLFIRTYPLNDLGGDTQGYFYVLLHRTSDLLFAPGYPFLAGLPLRVNAIFDLAQQNPGAFRKFLLIEQHAAELFCLAVLMFALGRVYNRATAAIAVLIAGCSAYAMGVTSSVFPEWLQADLLILSLSLAVFAFTAQSNRRKVIFYSAAFAAFTWCVLVKFNAVVFAPALVAFFVFERPPWRRRATIFLTALAFAAANYLAFVAFIHRPATGTWSLTRDKSWVLIEKLTFVYGDHGFPNPNAPATKRWRALSAVLPPRYDVAGLFTFMSETCCVEGRDMRRHDALFLVTAPDDVVDGILRMHPLPAGYSQRISSIPISAYVGLKESDDLGTRVFLESIRHAPRPYVRSVLGGSAKALWYSTTEPLYPTLFYTSTQKITPAGPNTVRVELRPDSPLVGYWGSSDPFLWTPGHRLFSAAGTMGVRRSRVVILMALGLVVALWHALRFGWSLRSAAPVVLSAELACFVLFSNAILDFRWKEWRFIHPVMAILIAITLAWALPELVRSIALKSAHERKPTGRRGS